ncbi:hemin uptake protein HemP [Pseudoduganella aquatica]|uniref:hemin uptake protein HemP n=1 Tax=Pseudoduganella aquatica TaxID=2660641 RepID=UPI001E3A5F39|nr:hemin uptake protein HemP [Pseudoduganella aquatica]
MHAEKSPLAPAGAALPAAARSAAPAASSVRRLTSAGLMQDQREVEIEHGNKVYRLRITQLGKLILTA